jgi:hypothetical protein
MAGRIPKVVRSEGDQTYLRDGITAAFFLPLPLDAVADSVLAVFDKFIDTSLAQSLRWSSLGADAEEWKRVNNKTFDRCRAMLSKEATRKRKLTAFEIFDGKQDGDAPTVGFAVLGNPRDKKEPRETNLVQMYFPSESIATDTKADAFVAWLVDLASLMPYVSGYASPGLHWAESHQIEALTDARGLAKRYAGFDVQNNDAGRSDIDTMTRGARWLTFLGPDLIKKIGPKAINSLGNGITVQPAGGGLMIRAGTQPEMGDRNRRESTPMLSAVAKLLRAVTLVNEPALLETVFAIDDPTFFREWEQRFFDGKK